MLQVLFSRYSMTTHTANTALLFSERNALSNALTLTFVDLPNFEYLKNVCMTHVIVCNQDCVKKHNEEKKNVYYIYFSNFTIEYY